MAQAFEDFSAYSAGNIETASGGNWSQTSGGNWTRMDVEADAGATGGKVFAVEDESEFWGDELQEFVYTSVAATSGDIEVYARLKAELTSLFAASPLGVCLTDGLGNEYALNYSGAGKWDLYYFEGGSQFNAIQEQVTAATLAANTYFRMRLGRSGTTIRAKVWADGDTEPASWQLSGTNTDLTSVSAGLVFQDSSASPYTVDVFGVGTGTDSAPTSSGGGGGTAQPFPPSLHRRLTTTVVRIR